VIAHPGRYRLSKAERRAICLAPSRTWAGAASKSCPVRQKDDETREFSRSAREFGFLASRGSDFHGPGESWIDLGRLPDLSEDLTPVWSQL
jgi:predicted metal-dependent phosphoesterase TrpH